jgi:hypothetical protein
MAGVVEAHHLRKSSQLSLISIGFGKVTTEFRADDIDSYFVLPNMLIL